MARGRPRISEDEKARRREQKLASKDQAIADTAMAKLPAEKELRDRYFAEAEELKSEAQGVAGQIGQHKKRGQELYGITKEAMQIRAILKRCKQGVYEATVKQLGIFLKDLDRPFQLSMFDAVPGTGPQPDEEGSIFDKTSSGERHAAERGDDPARATKRKARGGPPAAPDTGAMPLDEAEAAFRSNGQSSSAANEGADLRPGFLRGEGTLKGLGPDAFH